MEIKIKKTSKNAPAKAELTKEQCQELCARVGLTYHDGYENRVLKYTITDETTDRSGDIVRHDGVDWAGFYPENPVVMFQHQSNNFPVGKAIDIWKDTATKSVQALTLFVGDEVDPSGMSEKVFRFASNGVMTGCSIGAIPKEDGVYVPKSSDERGKIGLGKYGVEYKALNLHEFSVCSIPDNPSARTKSVDEMIKKGLIDESDLDLIDWKDIKLDKAIASAKEILSDAAEIKKQFELVKKEVTQLTEIVKCVKDVCNDYAEMVEAQKINDLIKSILK